MVQELGKVIILCSGKESLKKKKEMRLGGLFFLHVALFSELELTCPIVSALPNTCRGSFSPCIMQPVTPIRLVVGTS